MGTSATEIRPRVRASFEWTLVGAGFLLYLFELPKWLWGDDNWRIGAMQQLLAGKLPNVRYSLVQPVLALPLYLLGKVGHDPRYWLAYFNPLIFIGGTVAMCWLLEGVVSEDARRRFALLLVSGSLFSNLCRQFTAELFTAILVGVGTLLSIRVRRGWWLVFLGIANTPGSIGAFGLLSATRAVQRRRLRYLIWPVLAVALQLGDTWFRRGSPFASYDGRGFDFPLGFGLLAILFSYGRGILFYMSGLLFVPLLFQLGREGRLRELAVGWVAFLGGLVLVYSRWWAWYGGVSYGPRFFAFGAILAALALALALGETRSFWSRLVALVSVLLGGVVGYTGALTGINDLGSCFANNYKLEYTCWYVPQDSTLWHPFVTGHWPHDHLLLQGYIVGTTLYLAAPLAAELAKELFVRGRALVRGWAF